MTWQYIAGFFDGEGNIYFSSKKSSTYKGVTIKFLQAVSNRDAIDVIHNFLLSKKIAHSTFNRTSKHANTQNQTGITISHHIHVLNFLEKIEPYLTNKRAQALNAIFFIKNKNWIKKHTTQEYQTAFNIYKKDMSIRAVSDLVGISPRALRSNWLKMGLKTRSRKEGTRLYWST